MGTIIVRAAEFTRGQTWKSGRYSFQLSDLGNLEVRNALSGKLLWESKTRGGHTLAMQTDGNLVLYWATGAPLWATNTDGNPGAFLAVQEDGNVVIYARNGKPLWATNSSGG